MSLDANLPNIPNPYLQALGGHLTELREGYAAFSMEVGAQHLNRQGKLHGGAIASLLDVACGYAGLIGTEDELIDAITLSLAVSYIQTVSSGHVRVQGKVSGGGQNIYFAEASLSTDDGVLLACATGTFKRHRYTG
ncbi:hotdog fold thioesterase [Pseudomonas sp. S31]|uniref:PaaI family thioesterase n=1 Tax=Pseudomonas sp. S31 TaxID=1564473 RepID=UPI0019145444|nr:PaaI family thioesterase [Pseudomonas sp. S31]MBK5002422.1 hotdog fold thioesterase [Pseudomonas sp. S31]